jgi:hypothetical protein
MKAHSGVVYEEEVKPTEKQRELDQEEGMKQERSLW